MVQLESGVGGSLPERLQDAGPFHGRLLDDEIIFQIIKELGWPPPAERNVVLYSNLPPKEALEKNRDMINECYLKGELDFQ